MAKRRRIDADLDDDSDLRTNIDMYVETFEFKLRKWAVENNIALMAVTPLLKLLLEEGHTSLPKDARTLLLTPKSVKVTKIGKGQYWYRSLPIKLAEICKRKECPKILKISIHIDGMPPYRSSKLEFWPIQYSIKGVDMRPFFVGLHLGRSKPSCLKSFLKRLLDDLNYLFANGITINKNGETVSFSVKLDHWIFDAPARAYIKCIKSHSGYFSCERCTEEGVYLLKSGGDKPKKSKKATVTYNTVVNKKKKKAKKSANNNRGHVWLIGTDAPLRTDKTFREQQQEEHHTGKINCPLVILILKYFLKLDPRIHYF